MKYKTIISNLESLQQLTNEKMKISNAIKIARLIKILSTELEVFYEQKQKLLKEYGTLQEDDEQYSFSDDNFEKFKKEFEELLEVETKEEIAKITIEKEDILLSPAAIIALEDFIEFI